MLEFPSLIEFIDETGLEKLHENHEEYMENAGNECSFDTFVNKYYEDCRNQWINKMDCATRYLNVRFNDSDDVVLESAKRVMVTLIDDGLATEQVRDIICKDDLAPDYMAATFIVDELISKVIPAIENALNDLGK